MIKKAMILAAGFGKRIQPLTLDTPKPLLKIGEDTLLSNTLKFLKSIGIDKVIINTHYLSEKIRDYIKNKNFDLDIDIIDAKNEILQTGGGVLNAIKYFKNEPFIIINPDTIWNKYYLNELKAMKDFFLRNKESSCILLVVNKKKSFDKTLKGDFNLENNLLFKKNELKYIYSGLQIVHPKVFSGLKESVFPINKIWDQLILNKSLQGFESNNNFLHVSTLEIYKKLIKEFKF